MSKHLPNSLRDLLTNNLVKEYSILKFTDSYSNETRFSRDLVNWSRFMFEYNRISFGSNYIIPKDLWMKEIELSGLMAGVERYTFDAIQNSDLHSKPRILPAEHSATSSSIFLDSKPDAIMNIGIANYMLYDYSTNFFFSTRNFSQVNSVIIFTFR